MKNIPYIVYDAHYCANCCGTNYERNQQWVEFFDHIAEHVVNEIQPVTIMDAGCAMGFLVECLRKRDVLSFGIDVSEFAIQNVHPDIRQYCQVGSVCEPFQQKYDLIICIEVLEHLPPGEAEKAIANFCEHSDQILFSSSPEDFKEATHLNVQPVEYWAKLFARFGFYHDLDYDASYISAWAMFFRRRGETPESLVQKYERRLYRLWKENWDLRMAALETRRELAAIHQSVEDLKSKLSESENQARFVQSQFALLENSRQGRYLERIKLTWLYSLYSKLFQKGK